MKIRHALSKIAAIHQQHALKCFVGIDQLKQQFDWPPPLWSQIDQLIDMQEPQIDISILQGQQSTFDTVPRRRHWILGHGVYPHAYFTMAQWFDTEPASSIFDYYLAKAASSNEYLGHNISVLLAFINCWDLVSTSDKESSTDRLLFIERFTEFVTSSFYASNNTSYPLGKGFDRTARHGAEQVLSACLNQPGFWGHHLIMFAWIQKNQTRLGEPHYCQLLRNVHEQCFWLYEDPEDSPVITRQFNEVANKVALELHVKRLLLDSQRNLHQITLSEAVVTVYNLDWVEDLQKQRLLDILLHFNLGS